MVDRADAHGHRIFDNRPVFKIKWIPPSLGYPNGQIDKYKVRMTIAAYSRMLKDGVDFREKFASTPKWISIRIMFAIAAHFDLEVEIDDVVAFFLTAHLGLGEKIFMEQCEINDDGTGRICQVLKCIYGLPQAAYHAKKKLMDNFAEGGFKQCMSDSAVVVKADPDKNSEHALSITSMHVDDGLSIGTTPNVAKVRKCMKKVFELETDHNTTLVTGVQVLRCRSKRWLKIHQEGYVLKLLLDEQMQDAHHAETPLDPGLTKLPRRTIDLNTPENLAARKKFMRIFGCLMWLAVKTRPDLQFVVSFFSRLLRMAGVRELSWIRGQPLKYLNATRDHGIVYCSGGDLGMHGSSDADFAGCKETGRSMAGGQISLGKYGCVSTICKLMPSVKTSTGHSETAAQAMWCRDEEAVRLQCREYGLKEQGRTTCRMDNAGVAKQAINLTNHATARHYRVDQAYIKQQCEQEQVRLEQVPTEENEADFFTKALGKQLFLKHKLAIMGPQEYPGDDRS